MLAVLATLPFLATLWLLVVLGAAILEESGGKIAAALKGVPVQPKLGVVATSYRGTVPPRRDCPYSVTEPQWRAAA